MVRGAEINIITSAAVNENKVIKIKIIFKTNLKIKVVHVITSNLLWGRWKLPESFNILSRNLNANCQRPP